MPQPAVAISVTAPVPQPRHLRFLRSQFSWSPDGWVELGPARDSLIPEDSGVYLIHDFRGALYVGRSENLRRRYVQHERVRRNRVLSLAMNHPVGPLRFAWRLVFDHVECAACERELITILQPICNRQLSHNL